ncbi:MAG TPA: hypothetical protein VFJ82_11680 [Longimicrobium sp.]|nr:hypothetical protein [Longimicrobium sp.]
MDKVDNRTGIFHTINGETREIVVELPDRRLLAAYGHWPADRRLRAAADETRAMLMAVAAQLQALHPDWSREQVEREVARRQLEGSL